MSGLPAMRLSLGVVVSISGPVLRWAPGGDWGHTGKVRWPGAGSHAGFWATRLDELNTMAARNKTHSRTVGPRTENSQRRILSQACAANSADSRSALRPGICR